MKMKKLVSAIAALAMSVSAFAGLASAEATVYYSNDYQAEGATADWTTGTGGRFTPVLLTEGENTFLSVTQGERQNNGATLTGTSLNGSVAAGTDFTMEWDMRISSASNQTPVEFYIYDAAGSTAMFSLAGTGTWTTTWSINGDANKTVTLPDSNKAGSGNTIADVPWNHYKLTRSGDFTYLTITDASGNALFEQGVISTLSTTGGLGKMTFITKRYFANFAIDNIVVRSVEDGDVPTAESADYTINYTLGDAVVSSVTGTNFVGEVIPAVATITAEGVKYFITAEEVPTLTLVSGENVLNVPVREANKYTVTVNATGAVEKNLATVTDVVEGESASYPYPKYLADATTLYSTTTAFSGDGKGYQGAANNVTEDTTVSIEYTTVADTTVAYFSEAEDIEGGVACTTGNANARCSNGTGAYFEADTTVTTLPAGKYVVAAGVWGGTGVTFTINAGETTALTGDTLGWFNEYVGEEITLTEDTTITVLAAGNGGNSSKVLDYILIKKTGDVVVEPELTLPEVAVTTGTDYTENAGNPARTYTGTFTVGENNVAVSGVLWTVGEATATSTFDTVISSGTVVTGLVVVAADLAAIPAPTATAVAAE